MRITVPDFDHHAWVTASCSWGVALIMCGQMIGWSIRGYTPFADSPLFPAIPFLMGMAMLVRPRWLYRARLQTDAVNVAIPVLLIFIPCAAMSVVDVELNKEQIIYMSLMAVLAVQLSLNRREDFSELPSAIMIVGTVGCVLAVLEFVTSPLETAVRMTIAGNNNPVAIATNAVTTACAGLIVGLTTGKNKITTGLFAAFSVCIGFANTLLSGTRSAMAVFPLCVAIYVLILLPRMRRDRPDARSGRRLAGFLGSFAAIALLTPLLLSTYLSEQFTRTMWPFIVRRVATILGVVGSGAAPHDPSMFLHEYSLQYNWDNLNTWGHGVMAQAELIGAGNYAHNIYLQGFFDLGFVGGTMILMTGLILPLAFVALRIAAGKLTASEALVIILFVRAFFDEISHGTPYSWAIWLPTLLIYVLFIPRGGLRFGVRLPPVRAPLPE